MAKLTRQAQQIFAGQAPSDMIAAFGSTQTGTPVYSTDLSTLQTTNYQQGWQDAIIADKAPFLEEMNGVQYGLSYQIAYAQQMGIPEWLSTQDYYINSRAIGSDGNIYKSLTDSNTGNNPISDDGTNWVLDTIPEANVLNYITNCITSAPNGVATYSGSTITVKQGLKVLIPNGRNADGTLNNIVYTVEEDITVPAGPVLNEPRYLFLLSNGTGASNSIYDLYISSEQPTVSNIRTTLWYNPETNLYQLRASGTNAFNTVYYCLIAQYGWNGSTITSFNTYQPVELLKRSDKAEITSWFFPDWEAERTLITATGQYTIPFDCYLLEYGVTVDNTNIVHYGSTNTEINNVLLVCDPPDSSAGVSMTSGVYVEKGTPIFITRRNSPQLWAIPLKGQRSI